MPLASASFPVEDPLEGFSTKLVYSYIGFNRTRDSQELHNVILGVLEFYMGSASDRTLHVLPGTTRLNHDLGCDLQTVADTICMLEMLFGVEFDAADIARVTTLDDLQELVAGRVSTVQAVA